MNVTDYPPLFTVELNKDMPFCRITAHLTVDEKNVSEISEALLSLIDSFIVKNIPVYDSDVCSQATDPIEDAEDIREELTLKTS
jgi:hypothetical protein